LLVFPFFGLVDMSIHIENLIHMLG
jgi:hypothetical protein